ATGEAGGFTNLANLAQAYGGNVANLAGSYGGNIANLAGSYGGNIANLAGGLAQNQVGIARNGLSTDVGPNNLAAAGEAAGAKNLLGAGLALATLAMGGNPFGGSMAGGGGSSLLSSLGNTIKGFNLGQNWFGGGSPAGYGAA